MSQHRVSPHGTPLRSFPWLGLLGLVGLGGCYQGEWRLGVDVPVSTSTRLVPTRDVERWELVSSTVPHVLQVKATVSPRCRYVLYGTNRRTDTGRFKRLGGSWWSAMAILTGTAGGAAGGFGLGGWFSDLYPEIGRPAMYGAGAAVAAGGLGACIAALARPTKVRLAMCGILVGFGGSVLAGAGISGIPAPSSLAPTPTSPGFVPLIDVSTFRSLSFAGAGLVGGSIVSGIIAATWRDYIDRERIVDTENAQSWDSQTSEQPCGTSRPMAGRTAALEITSEYLTEGLGSDASPLKIRVALGGQSSQAVDLRPLRQSLPSCGALRVQLAPDIVYETYTEDYVPPVPPDQILPAARPIHGIITPRDGVWLPAIAAPTSDRRATPKRPVVVPGISPEILAAVEKHCRGDVPSEKGAAAPREPAEAQSRPAPPPSEPVASSSPPERSVERPAERQADSPASPASRDGSFVPTPGLTPQRRPLARGDGDEGECSAEAHQARFADCEHQCGRALELHTCLFDFRQCHINARGTALPQKEHDACDLAWEQCLFKANIAPGSWRRCVEGCTLAHEPEGCKPKN